MAQTQLEQAMKNKQEDSLAFQTIFLFQEMSQLVEEDQNFFLGNNVDQQKQIMLKKQQTILPKKTIKKNPREEIQHNQN